jgi:hypothetical protein
MCLSLNMIQFLLQLDTEFVIETFTSKKNSFLAKFSEISRIFILPLDTRVIMGIIVFASN